MKKGLQRLTTLIFIIWNINVMAQTTDTAVKSRFELAPLPYGYDALAPAISEETMRFHHDKHAAGYVAKLNELITGTPWASMSLSEIILKSEGVVFNNAAQIWNHEFYFAGLSPRGERRPKGPLRDAIEVGYGSFERLKEEMIAAATGLFGSGYVWLVETPSGGLEVVTTTNAGNPMCDGKRPLLCIDVWEHAYYIDYRNVRLEAVKAVWECIDWAVVDARYQNKR